MRRLAMLAATTGLVAFLPLGPDSSSGAPTFVASPTPAAAEVATLPAPVRLRSTTVDQARLSIPLPKTAAVVSDASRRRAAAARTSRSGGGLRGDVWAALARCESGGDPTARSAGGRYTGAFQFSDPTWQSLGYQGSAADHPYDVQVAAAKRLQARSGWGQWPRCSSRLGLR